MPRVSREQAAQSKARILQRAAFLFRKQGYHATGLDQVMREAGLTLGTFYAHFDSKEDLLVQVLKHLLPGTVNERMGEAAEGLAFDEWIQAFAESYLSLSHRDSPEKGCPLPSLAPELARGGREIGRVLDEVLQYGLKRRTSTLAKKEQSEAEDRLLACLALGVGAISLSRALGDSPLSKRVLKAAKRLAL